MEQPLDLSLPKKTIKIIKEETVRIYNDIEPLVLPARRYFIPSTNLENPAVLEKRVGSNVIACNAISFEVEPKGAHMTNKLEDETARRSNEKCSSFVERTVSPVDNFNGFVEKKIDENETYTTGTTSTDDDDDDRSSTSEMSLFAPSLWDLDMDESVQDNNRTNGWNRKTNDVVADLEELQKKTMDEQIKEIFAVTIKNSPEMISPIHDPPHLAIDSSSNFETKRKLDEFQGSPIIEPDDRDLNDIAEYGDAAKRFKCQRWLFHVYSALNQSEHSNESHAPLDNIVETTTKVDITQPVNGMKFRSKIDFKNLGKITINAGNLNSSRIVSIPNANSPVLTPPLSAKPEPLKEQVNTVPVYSTPSRFQPSLEQPLIIQSAAIPKSLVENMVDRSQSAQRAASEALDEIQSAPGAAKHMIAELVPTPIDSVQNVVPQSAQEVVLDVLHRMQTAKSTVAEPLTVQSVSTPIDSVENVVTHSQTGLLQMPEPGLLQMPEPGLLQMPEPGLLQMPEQLQGMQTVPILSTPTQFQQSPEQLLTIKPISIPQPMNSVQKVVAHSQPEMQVDPEHLHRMQSVPIQSTPPKFQPALKQPSITQSLTMPQPTDWFAENLITSSPKQWSDYWQSDDVRHRYIVATLKLFEYPCINFLSNKPCAVPISCPYNHQLPNTDKILSKMHTYPNEKIQFIHQTFITKSLPTFTLYFPWVCCLLGIRKMEETLLSSVRYCDKYGKYDFYRYIFGGLMMSGKSDKEALGIMVDFVDICEENFAVFYEIMKNPINPFLY